MRLPHRTSQSGNVLLGAMAAVALAGTVGAGMVAMYESYVKNARYVFVKAAMTSLDNKIRYMAMQPYAYNCGTQAAADQLGGVDSCSLNKKYFDSVMQVPLPGTCPDNPNCGFTLDLDPDQTDPTKPKFGYQVRDIGGVRTGVFLYNLKYNGTDFKLRPGGQDLDADGHQRGMAIPREVLQSEDFDCAMAAGGATPVFQGFGPDGRPICVGIEKCPPGQHVKTVNFKSLTRFCEGMNSSQMTVNCASRGQFKVSHVNWHDGTIDTGAACSELPTPPPPGPVDPCGPAGCAPTPPKKTGVCNDVTWSSSTGANYPSYADCGPNCVRKNIALPDSVQPPNGCTTTGFTVSWGFYAHSGGFGGVPHCQTQTPPMDITLGDMSRKTFGFGGICGPRRNNKTSCTYTQMDGPRSFFFGDVTYGYSSGATGCLEDVNITLHSRPN